METDRFDILDDTVVNQLALIDDRLAKGESIEEIGQSGQCAIELHQLRRQLEGLWVNKLEVHDHSTIAKTTQIIDHIPGYEIVSILGQGGMGVVYLAKQLSVGRLVAVKMILEGVFASEQARLRFSNEAEIIARLQHPGIVQVFDYGKIDGRPFISLEYVSGGSLDRQLNGTPWEPHEAAVIIKKIAEALSAAHDQGVIHRDLKPANILLTEKGEPKITDFGLAKQADSSITVTNARLGTLSYMAPELVDGKAKLAQFTSDIYSLGAILYELLTGRPPVRGLTPFDTIKLLIEGEAVPARKLQPCIPKDLETVCHTCLQHEPQKRYASAIDVAKEIEKFLVGKPIAARPTSRFDRGLKWCRRNPKIAALTVGVFLSLLLGALVSLIFALESNSQKLLAEERSEELSNALYTATMREVTDQLRTGNRESALDLLNSLEPKNNEKDRRDFAWHIVHNQLLEPNLVFLSGHPGRIANVRLSRDGRWFVTSSHDGTLTRWNTETGASTSLLAKDESAYPAIQSDRVFFLTDQLKLGSWEPDKPMIQGKRFQVNPSLIHRPAVLKFAVSKDSRWLVGAIDKEGLFRVDLNNGHSQSTDWSALGSKQDAMSSPIISPNSQWILTQLSDSSTHLWSLTDFKYLRMLIPKRNSPILFCQFSNDSTSCYLGYCGYCVLVRLADGAVLNEWKNVLESTNSRSLGTSSADGNSQYYAKTNGEVVELNLKDGVERIVTRHPSQVLQINLDSNDALLTIDKSELRYVQVSTGLCRDIWQVPEELQDDEGLKFLIHSAYDPIRKTLILCGDSGKIALWKVFTPAPVKFVNHGNSGVWNAKFSPNSSIMATSGDDGNVRLWDPITGELVKTLKGHSALVPCIEFSPDGQYLASGSYDREVRIWSIASGECINVLKNHRGAVRSLAWSPDGKWVAVGTKHPPKDDHRSLIYLWDAGRGNMIRSWVAHEDHVRTLLFSLDGKLLFSGSEDGNISTWQLPDGAFVISRPDQQQVWTLRTLGDSLFTSGEGRHISEWSLAQGKLKNRITTPEGHHHGLAVTPDGRTVAVGGENGNIRLIQAKTGLELTQLNVGKDKVLGIDISPNGKLLAAACASGKVRLWRVK